MESYACELSDHSPNVRYTLIHHGANRDTGRLPTPADPGNEEGHRWQAVTFGGVFAAGRQR